MGSVIRTVQCSGSGATDRHRRGRSAAVAAPLVTPRRVEVALLFQGTALRRAEKACCFPAPFVVVEGEIIDGSRIGPPGRLALLNAAY